MGKELRFSELVKKSGHPQTVSLWTNPAKDRPFMKAVKENRVLTVVQQPHSKHKDSGQIGFNQQPFATYLVFPKALPKNPDARVIGLKYDLIEEPKTSRPANVKPEKSWPKPAEKDFVVTVRRTATLKTDLTISARSESEAKKQALERLKGEAFDATKAAIQDRVNGVKSR